MNERGQTTTEYIMLMAVVAGMFMLLFKGLQASHLQDAILKPIQQRFAAVYQNGHPKAIRGIDTGKPIWHPQVRADNAEGNFRIFLRRAK